MVMYEGLFSSSSSIAMASSSLKSSLNLSCTCRNSCQLPYLPLCQRKRTHLEDGLIGLEADVGYVGVDHQGDEVQDEV